MDVDVFVSYHTESSLHIVEAVVNRLEANGVRCWYASRDNLGAYAGSIAQAIHDCAVFLLILNRPASQSVHVLNEIDLVTKRLDRREPVTLLPFHVADDEITADAQYYLGRLHWIDAMTPPMYRRVEELTDKILQILGRTGEGAVPASGQGAYRLINKLPQARSVFVGREDLLEQIGAAFAGGTRTLFLEGIGGIGKSELAKQYALANMEYYRQILFVTFTGSLQSLVCDPAQMEIAGLVQEKGEPAADFMQRKLKVFRTLADDHTLLIVDNFDVDGDPDLELFLEGSHKILFTTRNAHPGYPSLKVAAMPDPALLMQMFELNYGMPVQPEDRPWLERLFARIEYHTYTVELLAKQMQASFLTPREMLALLEQGGAGSLTEPVAGRRDQKTAFEHICALFSVSGLSPEEQQILRMLSLMGVRGVPAGRFREWAGLSSFQLVNRLIQRSWVRRGTEQRLSLHPLVAQVVQERLGPDEENCLDFLERMGAFLFRTWSRPVQENLVVADNILAAAEYFRPYRSCPKTLPVWLLLPSFLWQVGLFDQAIELETLAYDECLRRFGEASMVTGYAAKALGGCYFNSSREQESISWYRQGLRCMQLAQESPNEDLAMSYEKVARCCTWPYEQDFDQAAAYFQKALAIRLELKERLSRGKSCEMFESVWEPYTLELAMERIGETYMEMGRMYQAMGDYRRGLEYAGRQEEILLQGKRQNPSGEAYIYYDKGVCNYHLALAARAAGDRAGEAQLLRTAQGQFQQALDINLRMRGEVAVDTIDNEEYLADTYAALGDYGQASNCYMAVTGALEKLMGRDCPRIQTVKRKMCFDHKDAVREDEVQSRRQGPVIP